MAQECLRSRLEIERIFLTPACVKEYGRLFPVELCVEASEDVMKCLCEEKTPQGVLCRVRIPETVLEAPQDKCLLLDGISDPGNMGAIIRSANAAGFKRVYLTNDCTDPYSPKSVRASMSGIFFTKIFVAERDKILEVFNDFPLFVADMVGENVFSTVAPKQFALAIGNEGKGLSDEVLKRATKVISIPMQGEQESLNASVAAGIVMYILSKEEFLAK